MPEKKSIERARKDKEEGKAPSTQAGEFVREEMDHIREGKHGARSTNRRSRSACPRRGARESNCPRPEKDKLPKKRERRQSATSRRERKLQRASPRQNDPGRQERPCNVKDEKLLHPKHSRSKRDPRPQRGQRQIDRRLRRKPREPRAQPNVPRPHGKPPRHALRNLDRPNLARC